jgi:hypothetical protein
LQRNRCEWGAYKVVCKEHVEIDVLGKLILGLRHFRGRREANKLVDQAYIELEAKMG